MPARKTPPNRSRSTFREIRSEEAGALIPPRSRELPMPTRFFPAIVFVLMLGGRSQAGLGEVRGRVGMPETCASTVSRAVAIVEPLSGDLKRSPAGGRSFAVRLDQKSLRFDPRVLALKPGQSLRVANGDSEAHSVHIVSPQGRTVLSRSAPPGTPIEFRPTKPGVYQIVCDIHSHMRAFAVVGDTPWIKTCSATGRFRFDDLPAGRYALSVWHEAGSGLRREREFSIRDGEQVDLGDVSVQARVVSGSTRTLAEGDVRPWSEVIDRISVLLAGAIESAKTPGGFKAARKAAQDAYFVEFETSGMESAVAQMLGEERLVDLEGLFREFYGPEIRAIAENKGASGGDLSRRLLLALSRAGGDLDRQGVPDIAHLSMDVGSFRAIPGGSNRADRLGELTRAFVSVQETADRGEADDAAATLGDVYFHQFEPIERELRARDLSAALRLESRFLNLRGRVGSGLRGAELASAFQEFVHDVEDELARVQGSPASAFGPAFAASLGIMLREGVEVILILGMLLAIVSKSVVPEARRFAKRSIGQGVTLAIVASVFTAIALQRLVASSQGRAREVLEGFVLLFAAGVLFYVSYWLISQAESKRWMDFLKAQARKGAELGGFATLGLAAFLAVFREGAETALMYQAQIALFGQARSGRIGLLSGIGVGLAILAVVYVLIRLVGAKLPLRLFFQGSGVLLFAMAVVFAGKAVFELQSSGLIKITPLPWLGDGLPTFGVYPNAQGLAVQGLLLIGALAATAALGLGSFSERSSVPVPTTAHRTAVMN